MAFSSVMLLVLIKSQVINIPMKLNIIIHFVVRNIPLLQKTPKSIIMYKSTLYLLVLMNLMKYNSPLQIHLWNYSMEIPSLLNQIININPFTIINHHIIQRSYLLSELTSLKSMRIITLKFSLVLKTNSLIMKIVIMKFLIQLTI